jgi:succinate dehydrogenase/fumarate reductase flavoprotein subunit
MTAEVDVCVVESGSAGPTAAIAAARAGASVLLLDPLPFLGVTSTAVLDTFYGFYRRDPRDLDVAGLREHLFTRGAILELADAPEAVAR